MILSNANIINEYSDNLSEKISILLFRKKSLIIILRLFLISILALLILTVSAYSARIKDIAVIEGSSGVQVIGYGLVTGLNQTGDNQSTSFTVQSVSNMLKRFGLTVPQTNPRVRNVAAVMITALVPSFSRPGAKIDIQVSSIGDATSLQGGILLMTPVSRHNGNIIGMAQGAVSVGGYDYTALGSRVGKNSVTSGRVPGGLILEDSITNTFVNNNQIRILLRDPDFTTARNISNVINTAYANSAKAIDAATVSVQIPAGQDVIQVISTIEALQIIGDPAAKVVINERTGTIVIGGNVQLLPAVVAHGGLEITIQKQIIVTQPAPFTIRPPRPVESAQVKVEEQVNQAIPLNVTPTVAGTTGPATVQDMANALNLLKVSPRDLIAIFQALKESGSLMGELVIQ